MVLNKVVQKPVQICTQLLFSHGRRLRFEVRTLKRQPCWGREPVRNFLNFEQSVKQPRLLRTEFHELIHLNHPLVSIRSHIPPIIPAFYSRKLLKFVCPIHCWASPGPLHSVANATFDVPSVHVEGSWCIKQISSVERRKFQPTLSCGIPPPFLAHADSKYAEFHAAETDSITSYYKLLLRTTRYQTVPQSVPRYCGVLQHRIPCYKILRGTTA